MPLRRIAAVALVCTVGFGGPAWGQYVGPTLKAGGSFDLSHRLTPNDTGYDATIGCTVPAGSVGVVTLAKRSAGPSRHDLEVAERVSFKAPGYLNSSGVVGEAKGGMAFPSVVVIPPSLKETTWPVVTRGRDNHPARYRITCNHVSILEQAAWAGAQALFESFLYGGDVATDENVGRALNLALSVIQSNNVLAVGVDVMTEELMIELRRQFPNDRALVTFIGAFATKMIKGIYKDALYEMSPQAARW